VITHLQEAVENREVTLAAFLYIEGAFDSNSFYITTKAAKQLGHNLFMAWFHTGWPGVVSSETFYCLYFRIWLWTNSYEDSMGMAVTLCGKQMKLLSSSAENSQTPSQSFRL